MRNETSAENRIETGNVPTTASTTTRILVAVDTSRQSLAALEEAARLAALMQAELESIFIEDINLLRLCGFPFCNQIGSYTATPRRVDDRAMERELRGLAVRLRTETARIAQRAQVPWQFHVRRGAVVSELLQAAESALFLSLGRAGTSRRKTLGSTAQAVVTRATRPVLMLGENQKTAPPLIVIHTGDEASQRALALALRLAPRFEHKLHIWFQPPLQPDDGQPALDAAAAAFQAELEPLAQGYAQIHETPLQVEIIPLSKPGAVAAKLHGSEPVVSQRAPHHTVIFPTSQARLMAYHIGPTILVP